MGFLNLFGGDKASSSTNTTETKDQRVAIETNSGVIVSPEASITETYQGDVSLGMNAAEVNSIMSTILDKGSADQKRLTDFAKNQTGVMAGSNDKLTDIVETLKTDGASYMKYLPYISAALLIFVTMKGKK